MWKKAFTNTLHKCFRKVRIVKKKKMSNSDDLLKERVKMKNEMKSPNIDEEMKRIIEERIRHIEEEIGEEVVNDNHKVIIETVNQLGGGNNLNGSGRKCGVC